MAASYSTGTAASPVALVQAIVTWLVAQGWTSDSSVTDGSGHRAHLHKGSQYVNLRAAMNESIWNFNSASGYGVGLYLGTGYSGASNWRSQAGGPVASGGSSVIGAGMKLDGAGAITAYHFFDDGLDNITVVVEKGPGLFVHMGWGPTFPKLGYSYDLWYFYGSSSSYYNTTTAPYTSSTPGHEITAASPMSHCSYSPSGLGGIASSAFVRVDSAIFSGLWVGNNDITGNNAGNTGRPGRSARNATGAPSNLNEQDYPSYRHIAARSHNVAFPGAVLMPLHFYVLTAAARWAPVGYPPTVFFTTLVGHGAAASEVVAIGGLNYMVFPNFAVRKAA